MRESAQAADDIDGASGRGSLPRYLAPLPTWLEDLALRYVWFIVAINLAGTGFGFWYYRQQLAETALVMWPWVPDSPLATLFIALALAAWKLGYDLPWLATLAFFGNIVLGLWTPYVLVVFAEEFLVFTHPLMFAFLFVSHLGMVAQAFLLHRITTFPVWAVALALAYYTVNLIVDYFVPVVEGPHGVHHTTIPADHDEPMALGADAFGVTAAGEVSFTLLALFLVMAIGSALGRTHSNRPSK